MPFWYGNRKWNVYDYLHRSLKWQDRGTKFDVSTCLNNNNRFTEAQIYVVGPCTLLRCTTKKNGTSACISFEICMPMAGGARRNLLIPQQMHS